MKNNKGFIAISLIYSFFLVFLVTLLMIALNYAKNRILLSAIKNTTQEYLNSLSEFSPVSLENKTYENQETVKIGSEMWQVIEDKEDSVTLILNRNLTNEEISKGLETYDLEEAIENDQVLMCYNSYIPSFCNYQDDVTFNTYSWSNSIVKKIVDAWFQNDALLQKGVSRGNIIEMEYNDGLSEENHTYNSLVRIPTYIEYDKIDDGDSMWYLTSGERTNGISTIQIGSEFVQAHSTKKAIRPVITVKKST